MFCFSRFDARVLVVNGARVIFDVVRVFVASARDFCHVHVRVSGSHPFVAVVV